jgi:hypothetical protein
MDEEKPDVVYSYPLFSILCVSMEIWLIYFWTGWLLKIYFSRDVLLCVFTDFTRTLLTHGYILGCCYIQADLHRFRNITFMSGTTTVSNV